MAPNCRAVAASNGSGSAASLAAVLRIAATSGRIPVITVQPVDRIESAGQPARFAISVESGSPSSFQWKKNGVNFAEATGSSLTLDEAIEPDCGAGFTMQISNAEGSVTSTRATPTVMPDRGAPVLLRNVDREVRTALADLQSVESRVKALHNSVAESERVLHDERLKFEAGRTVINFVLDAESALLTNQ